MRRRIIRWTGGLLAGLFALASLYVAVLLFPSPLFSHAATFDGYRVYSDAPIPAEFRSVIEDLDRRLRAMDPAPPAASQRIYLCGPGKFTFFAFLTRRNPEGLAIGLSGGNESFVSIERVRLFAERNARVLRHTRFEGSVAEAVAHEIAHFASIHALGRRAHLDQPLWKSEGWAEYQANLAAIRADPDYDLSNRIGVLLDDGYWGGRHGLARFFWESQLLVEFLGEVEGNGLTDLVRDDVTDESTRARMLAWYRGK